VTLLRRRPREIYRVYSEEEYLNGAGSELEGAGAWPAGESPLGEWPAGIESGVELAREWPVGIEPASEWTTEVKSPEAGSVGIPVGELYDRFARPGSRPVRERRLRRVAGAAVLVGALGTVGGLVVLNLTRANGGGGGRRGSLVAATRSSWAVRSPAVDDAQPQVISSRPVLMRPAETARPRIPPIGRRALGGPGPRRPSNLDANPSPRRRADPAIETDYAPGPSSGEVSPPTPTSAPAPAAVQVGTPAAPVARPARPAPAQRPEFGFER